MDEQQRRRTPDHMIGHARTMQIFARRDALQKRRDALFRAREHAVAVADHAGIFAFLQKPDGSFQFSHLIRILSRRSWAHRPVNAPAAIPNKISAGR